jgi:hypothetical protein
MKTHKLYFVALFLLLQPFHLHAAGIRLKGFDYPFPVQMFAFESQQQADAESAQALKEAIEALVSYYPEHKH